MPAPKGRQSWLPPVHSKVDFACLLIISYNDTFRDTEIYLREIKTIERTNRTPLVRHMQGIPGDRLDLILAETARCCLAAAGYATVYLGADSSGVTATRQECMIRRVKRHAGENTANTIILGLLIVLGALYTNSNISDVTMLLPMLDKIKQAGFGCGFRFNADCGYDAEYTTFLEGYATQHQTAKRRHQPRQTQQAAEIFDPPEYTNIAGVFGAETTRRYQH